MEILLLALATLPRRAIATMDFLGAEIFGAV
jgi:hypothetical protein